MSDFFEKLTAEERQKIKKSHFPEWYSPMLATLTEKRFSYPSWVYEPKFDGERAFTYFNKGEINIFSRNKLKLNGTYPELVKAFENQKSDSFVIDGEIVAFDKEVTSFSRLQQRLGLKEISLEEALRVPVFYYLFDILYIDGFDVRDLSLKSRKFLLKKTLLYKDPLRFTEGRVESGEVYYAEACKKGWEGLIAKRLESTYQGKRSQDWLKFKCSKSQELIIIGYTSPKGKRYSFGALLVGYYDKGKLRYAGKVGTGFSYQMLKSLKNEMDKHISSESPLEERIRGGNHITWLNPALVGEFSFTEWTEGGKLRHPRFKGLRDDKDPKEVTRENPQ